MQRTIAAAYRVLKAMELDAEVKVPGYFCIVATPETNRWQPHAGRQLSRREQGVTMSELCRAWVEEALAQHFG